MLTKKELSLISATLVRSLTESMEQVLDQIVIEELKVAYRSNNKFDRVDCSDSVFDPDYELLNAIQTVLNYYTTPEEQELWDKEEKD